MTTKRIRRPQLKRDRPVRSWSTLFGPGGAPRAASTEREAAPAVPSAERPEAQTLSDSVDVGYRVIDDYLNQGRRAAQAFNPETWADGRSAPGDELPQMAQRVMQYGWDFAGLWFEMWSKMAAAGGVPSPFVAPASSTPSGDSTRRTPPASSSGEAGRAARVVVSVRSRRPTKTSLEVRPGSSPVTIRVLRAEGHDGPPIRDIAVEQGDGDGTIDVSVVVGDQHPEGTYNGLIVDRETNLPRGTLSVEILPAENGG